MTLYQKRQHLRGLKSVYNKLTHHLLDLRLRLSNLTEEIRQEELELYILTAVSPITYIKEGKSGKKPSTSPSSFHATPSPKTTKQLLNYISTLSADSKRELLINLRHKMEDTDVKEGKEM